MINKDFFKKIRILDGGMGQELLARGMKPNSTLWSANAILDENYHQLVLDTHIDFIKAGAEIIVTTTFATRQKRLKENNLLDKFEYLNQKAGEIAQAAKKKFPGSKNNLNALCRRFGISLESREKHGALTDSFLLLQVYNELLGGKQQTLSLKIELNTKQTMKSFNYENNKIVCATISPEEEESHREMLKTLKKNIW